MFFQLCYVFVMYRLNSRCMIQQPLLLEKQLLVIKIFVRMHPMVPFLVATLICTVDIVWYMEMGVQLVDTMLGMLYNSIECLETYKLHQQTAVLYLGK